MATSAHGSSPSIHHEAYQEPGNVNGGCSSLSAETLAVFRDWQQERETRTKLSCHPVVHEGDDGKEMQDNTGSVEEQQHKTDSFTSLEWWVGQCDPETFGFLKYDF